MTLDRMHLFCQRLRSRAFDLRGYVKIFRNGKLSPVPCHLAYFWFFFLFAMNVCIMMNDFTHRHRSWKLNIPELGIARHASPKRRAPPTTNSPSTGGVSVRRARPPSLRNLCSSWRSGGSNWYQPRDRGRKKETEPSTSGRDSERPWKRGELRPSQPGWMRPVRLPVGPP